MTTHAAPCNNAVVDGWAWAGDAGLRIGFDRVEMWRDGSGSRGETIAIATAFTKDRLA